MSTLKPSYVAFLAGLIFLALAVGDFAHAQTNGAVSEPSEKDFLSRVRRVTVDGRRAGEGYFSPEGDVMVFQSEREPGNPFYQIYEMDMTNGETRRISPGTGKTTCAFVQPGTGHIEYASTHLDPKSEEYQRQELDFRASGKERRYAWDYDESMDIFVHVPGEDMETRLTTAKGYDAEASYSPDGQWIVFTSMRDAYNRRLGRDDKERLETDPSYFAEIYIMRDDGSTQTRLTKAPGYDGGPFFFPDGSRIVWRRFTEDGLIADIWSMRPDGTEQTQLTDFGSMSWAPYVHPSGEYIFFASNKLGFTNFEIYIVDVAGAKQPVRVTYTDRFDGLPVPTPDGESLSWTSSRGGGEGAQIYMARWNHERAREALASSPAR